MTTNPLRVLLVEDNRADAVLLQEMILQVPSVTVDFVWEARLAPALERLGEQPFDAVLLDLTLPDSRGLETLERLHGAARTTPIVILTGVEDEELAVRAIRDGAQDYLVKGSASGRAIARAIQYAIDRKRMEETVATATAARAASDMIGAMTEGVLLIDMDGRVLTANPAMERITGYRLVDVAGHNIRDFLAHMVKGEDVERARMDLSALQHGKVPEMRPFTLHARDGRQVHVIPAAAYVHGAEGKPVSIVMTLRDVTQLMQARASLEESERKYRELVQNANSMIMRRRADGTITFFNEFAQRFFGYREDEIIGRNVIGTLVPEVDSKGRRLSVLIDDIGRHPEAHAANENENVCKDGRRVWVHWTNRALRDARGDVVEVLCVGTDATQRKKAEEDRLLYQKRLRSLAGRLATTEEQERRRISRLIHDTVIQSLSLSSLKLGAIGEAVGAAGLTEEQARLASVRELLEEGIRQSRLLMTDLAPPMLYELGLCSALDDLAERIERQHDVAVCVERDGNPEVSDQAVRGLLFQCARELVMNALKHASPSEIVITVRRDEVFATVCVRDDGAGFVASKTKSSRGVLDGGFGLFSIRERVEELGGRLDIESQSGRGAAVTIKVPVSPERAVLV